MASLGKGLGYDPRQEGWGDRVRHRGIQEGGSRDGPRSKFCHFHAIFRKFLVK